MNVTGIIMECSPFHEGHAYILQEARRETSADYVIAVMSGDFVQRGEPAVFDKYIRARQILRGGADLVLELPLYAACGSAEYFAQGGIQLLDRLGIVTDLCFGSESGQLDHLLQVAQVLTDTDQDSLPGAEFREKLQQGLRSGLSFPSAREQALAPLLRIHPAGGAADKTDAAALPSTPSGLPLSSGRTMQGSPVPSTPNDLLGTEYCRALLRTGSPIRPHAISRIDVPSATDRRREFLLQRTRFSPGLQNLLDREDSVPEQVPGFPLGPDDFSSQLLYALRMGEGELDQYADVSPDLQARIRRLLPEYRSFSSFCDLVKTRNVTRTRVSRALLHILLQIKKNRLEELSSSGFALYARPLAMRRSAAPLLAAIREKASIPFLSKLSAAPQILSETAVQSLQEEIRAEELYTLVLRSAYLDCIGSYHCSAENAENLLPGESGKKDGPAASPVPRAASRKLVLE